MKFLTKFIFITTILMFPICCFCEDNNTEEKSEIKIIDKETYQLQIKQYDNDYPTILYVVFKESTPLLDDIKKILRTELLAFATTQIEPSLKKETKIKTDNKNKNKDKTESDKGIQTIKKVVIASAWFNDQVSEKLEKIELTKKCGAFVWFYDEQTKSKKIITFDEYLKYLKKKNKIENTETSNTK